MLEVGGVVQSPLRERAHRVYQLKCARCRNSKYPKSCRPTNSPSSAVLSKCNACRDGKTTCTWGDAIPAKLNRIKIAIHAELLKESVEGEDAVGGEGDFAVAEPTGDYESQVYFGGSSFLKTLRKINRQAQGETQWQMQKVEEKEFEDMAIAIDAIRAGL